MELVKRGWVNPKDVLGDKMCAPVHSPHTALCSKTCHLVIQNGKNDRGKCSGACRTKDWRLIRSEAVLDVLQLVARRKMSVRILNLLQYIRPDPTCAGLIIQQHSDRGKGAKYVAQLYEARSNGQWHEVPELSRKVEKHAPTRKCMNASRYIGAPANYPLLSRSHACCTG